MKVELLSVILMFLHLHPQVWIYLRRLWDVGRKRWRSGAGRLRTMSIALPSKLELEMPSQSTAWRWTHNTLLWSWRLIFCGVLTATVFNTTPNEEPLLVRIEFAQMKLFKTFFFFTDTLDTNRRCLSGGCKLESIKKNIGRIYLCQNKEDAVLIFFFSPLSSVHSPLMPEKRSNK